MTATDVLRLPPGVRVLVGVMFRPVLTGVTMSMVLLAFTGESVARTFLVAAGMFSGLAAYGTITKRSLGGLGQFLFMGLVGIVLASIVGLFWHSDVFQFVLGPEIAGTSYRR
jgi:uncharacterized protein